MTYDYVDQLLFACPRQIGDGSIERPFLHLRNFFQRQFRLSACWLGGFLVTFDELAGEPAKNIVSDASCVSNVWILCEAARFKSLVSEFFHEALERHAILQGNRGESADGIHQSADRASLL